ncbi:XrtA system polysaccharide deacetylase [Geobacter sp. AOG2]|uniref:XrtA system polysaccharide deacetylase n=1 Tax=Geobacter sp. AOG2 TaxID=1566347 RepID=UPI001CC45458|nr:XrtA system polysaccharide deacetylase [Geobacter sp. AOG2]GFE60828.1 polysaccharide deacetylase [Geobacter sp. AOG2]
MLNALTIDVEDYFQVNAFARQIRYEDWDHYPLRVERNTSVILDMLDEFGVKATFFILGWVAERAPDIVKEIHRRGHEIACHGYGHQLVYAIGPDKFREDIAKSRSILENISGERVIGYRAPSYSITRKSMWALEILVEEGFEYDSSIFPIIHDTYGIPDASRFPGVIRCASGVLREFPLSTLSLKLFGKDIRLPVAGGGYLRLFPARMIDWAINTINRQEKQPTVLYFHPWEIDPHQPRIKTGLKSRFRHYVNLEKTEGKLRALVSRNNFGTMREVLEACVPIPAVD